MRNNLISLARENIYQIGRGSHGM